MFSWPDLGTRVTVRYRRAQGSVPPLTDAVGHLLTVDPVVRVRTKTGAVVEFAPADVVALRVLTDAPVRTSQIRALEHAAAAAWPGAQRTHLDGWLLRAGHGAGLASNSAVPLDISANIRTIPAIVAWYERRGLPPLLAIPDRLLELPQEVTDESAERILVRDLSDLTPVDPDPSITLAARPDDAWLRIYRREIPVDVLTAVLGGELAFGIRAGTAVARVAVTEAPDGTRWAGLSAIRATVNDAQPLSEALLAWAVDRGAARAYLRGPDSGATPLADALGFRLHHRRRYVIARPSSSDSV
jgi:N-acetylglutamate synthase